MTTADQDEAKPHVHVFDPVSGYCVRGCVGFRDDGRLIHKGGAILRTSSIPLQDIEPTEGNTP